MTTIATVGHLRALVLAVTAQGRFAALTVVDGNVMARRAGGDLREIADLLDGMPVVTDAPERVRELLDGLRLHSTVVWDVLELATLLAPKCPRDSLERVTEFFGIAVEGAGVERDAQCLLMLFELLLAVLDRVDTQTLLHARRLAAGLDWPLSSILANCLENRELSAVETGALAEGAPIGAWITDGATPKRRRPEPPGPPAAAPILDPSDVADRLGPSGPIAAVLEGYESRPEQALMTELVARALNAGGQLLVEAGTGTGKSLAYLVPAAMRAVVGQQRVLVSTATTTLQDQLFEHDLPLVETALGAEQALRAVVLKGRNNYLCLGRWQTLLHAGDLSAADRMLLIKTLFWLPRTATGDRAELHLSQAEEESWQRVCAVTEACTPSRCAYHRIGVCFLARARRAAEESHVVIANHALLLSDLVSRSRVLPEYDMLVVDEAHHLEDEATQQLGWRLGERELLGRLERILSSGLAPTGAIPEALGLIAAGSGMRLAPELRSVAEGGEQAATQLGAAVRRFYEGLQRLLQDPELTRGDDSALRITGAIRAGSLWQELEETWSEAASHAQQLERTIAEVVSELEAIEKPSDAAHDLASELSAHLDYWRDVRRRLQVCVHEPGHGTVYWISGGGRFRSAFLNAAPIDVSSLLRERLFEATEASVLVSATLAIGGSFAYVKRRLGVDDAAAHALGSPFDYARAALLYVPNDLPEPTQPGYQAVLERTIIDVGTRLNGRTMVLFTSRAHLKATYDGVREHLRRAGVTVLAQGVDESSRTRLLENFRRGSKAVLFGTNAFWEGIDVVGDALSCVMVTRLPFAVPTDPVYAARAEQFDRPFADYAVPQAVLRMKQGFGRLIRSRTDRGAVIVLDRRIVTRFYGQVFLRSLPPCSVKQGPSARAAAEAAGWLLMPDFQQMELLVAPG